MTSHLTQKVRICGRTRAIKQDSDAILPRLADKEKHKEFKQKRKGHYSNEAEAMRLAQSLMAQETPEDETDDQ
jgi:hypothetical protein